MASNDGWAYLVGRSFGRTSLITLSPNKTVEGFLGGAFFVVLTVLLYVGLSFEYPTFICQIESYSLEPFHPVNCLPELNSGFQTKTYTIFGAYSYTTTFATLVACMFGLFTSIAGPFAGFLASGIKRGYQIKDFSDSLPGHGGFLDRFDCQMLVSCFGTVILQTVMFKDQLDLQ